MVIAGEGSAEKRLRSPTSEISASSTDRSWCRRRIGMDSGTFCRIDRSWSCCRWRRCKPRRGWFYRRREARHLRRGCGRNRPWVGPASWRSKIVYNKGGVGLYCRVDGLLFWCCAHGGYPVAVSHRHQPHPDCNLSEESSPTSRRWHVWIARHGFAGVDWSHWSPIGCISARPSSWCGISGASALR